MSFVSLSASGCAAAVVRIATRLNCPQATDSRPSSEIRLPFAAFGHLAHVADCFSGTFSSGVTPSVDQHVGGLLSPSLYDPLKNERDRDWLCCTAMKFTIWTGTRSPSLSFFTSFSSSPFRRMRHTLPLIDNCGTEPREVMFSSV